MKRVTYLSLFFLLVLTLFSCKKEVMNDGWDDTINSGLIRIACDENFKTLMDAEIAVFEAHNPEATIIPIYTNETEAIRLLIGDSVRFALTTRDLNTKERTELTEKRRHASKKLVAFDGIAVIVNQSNTASFLPLPTLNKILSGEIILWSQIDPGFSADTIRVLFDNKESGVLRYFVDLVFKRPLSASNLYALNTPMEVIERVGARQDALGIIGVNAISDETSSTYFAYRDKIRMVKISNEETATEKNSYLPYAGDIRQENYPLWRSIYVLLSDPKTGLSSGLSIFLAYEIGQKIVLKSGLLPITDPQNMSVSIKNEYPK
jgi:phosphate transport system substrate-binding protein